MFDGILMIDVRNIDGIVDLKRQMERNFRMLNVPNVQARRDILSLLLLSYRIALSSLCEILGDVPIKISGIFGCKLSKYLVP